MKGSVKIVLGSKVLNISGEGAPEAIMKNLSFWTQLPDKCGNCSSKNVGLFHMTPKGNDYYGMKCLDCGATFNFSQFKKGGFFIKPETEWVIWKAKSNYTEKDQIKASYNDAKSANEGQNVNEEFKADDDIPF